jgi:hypothetical protein
MNGEGLDRLVGEKDAFSAAYCRDVYGFELAADPNVFDVILDISSFIEAPTLDASARSIRRADEIVNALVGFALTAGMEFRAALQRCVREHGAAVFVHVAPRFSV